MHDIDPHHLTRAIPYLAECAQHADIHTVELTTNGQTGMIDLTIMGLTIPTDDMETEEYERTYRI